MASVGAFSLIPKAEVLHRATVETLGVFVMLRASGIDLENFNPVAP